jgi:2,3-bisphosphoglycerate-independent phosphoglycerate mutase
VPVVLVNGPAGIARLSDGRLADIAPTVLALMGLEQPAAMTGRPLFVSAERARAAGAGRAAR